MGIAPPIVRVACVARSGGGRRDSKGYSHLDDGMGRSGWRGGAEFRLAGGLLPPFPAFVSFACCCLHPLAAARAGLFPGWHFWRAACMLIKRAVGGEPPCCVLACANQAWAARGPVQFQSFRYIPARAYCMLLSAMQCSVDGTMRPNSCPLSALTPHIPYPYPIACTDCCFRFPRARPALSPPPRLQPTILTPPPPMRSTYPSRQPLNL